MVEFILSGFLAIVVIMLAIQSVLYKLLKSECQWFKDCNKSLMAENSEITKRNEILKHCDDAERMWEIEMMKVIGEDGVGSVSRAIQSHKNVLTRVSYDLMMLSHECNPKEVERVQEYVSTFMKGESKKMAEAATENS